MNFISINDTQNCTAKVIESIDLTFPRNTMKIHLLLLNILLIFGSGIVHVNYSFFWNVRLLRLLLFVSRKNEVRII